MLELPQRARVVIVGGGVIGCSVAYHLAHMGWKDVLLLERDRLTSGTTWHAAGLMVTFGSTSETSTEMRKYTRDLYSRLEAETGQATGFNPVGFIEVAADADRLEEFRRKRFSKALLNASSSLIGDRQTYHNDPTHLQETPNQLYLIAPADRFLTEWGQLTANHTA